MKLERIVVAAGVLFAVSIVSSSIHPWGDVRRDARNHSGNQGEILQGSETPPEVRRILEKKCGDCHSDNTRWPIYSRLAPGSWLMERDVHAGREGLNLSHWQDFSTGDQLDLLAEIGSVARNGWMPLRQYLILHRDARLTAHEQEQIYQWSKTERRRIKATEKPRAKRLETSVSSGERK